MKISWPYVAGFFDGEGCITLYDYERKRTYKDKPNQNHIEGKEYTSRDNRAVITIGQRTRIFVILNQVENTVLPKIAEFLEDNEIECKLRREIRHIKKPNWSDVDILSVTKHESVLKFLENMLPYLIVKKDKADITINYIKNKQWGKHTKHER